MSDNRTKLIVGAVAAVGTLISAGIVFLLKKKAEDPVPTKWKKIGQIHDLNMFPVKSCAPMKCQSFDCHSLGFQWNGVFDRCFIVAQNNHGVSASTYPKMLLIQSQIVENQLTLTVPGQSDFILNINKLRERAIDTNVKLWMSQGDGVDAGDEVANWLSQYIANKSGVFRLIFYPFAYPTRAKSNHLNKYKSMKYNDIGTYHSETSYMLINQASIDDLNTRLEHPVSSLQFRPNIVIDGPAPYEEDRYKWVRIGENAVFQCIKPCFRCVFINVNPDTGERNPQFEPLKTLSGFRKVIPNEDPVMGVLLAIRSLGQISIGDDVFIPDER